MNEIMKKRSGRISVAVYLAVWLFCVGWFWLGRGGGGWIMAYTILAHGVLVPLAALVSAFLLARERPLGGWFWGAMVLYSVLNFGAIAATFMLSTAIGVTKMAPPDAMVILLELVPGAVGLGLGWLFRVKGWGAKGAVAALLVLLAVCWLLLKSVSVSPYRFLPFLDVPALVLLGLGLWFLLRKNKGVNFEHSK